MSRYTTGEVAKLCGVTVRTVQYYDTRGILIPTELTEGGRRLYSEEDLNRLKTICFLRELGLPIDSISQLLSEEEPERVISLILEQQEQALKDEIGERQEKLEKLEALKRGIKSGESFSVEQIGDIAHTMTSNKKLKKVRWTMLLTGLPVSILQWGAIILGFMKRIWWPLLVWLAVAVPYGVWVSRYYFRSVAYICPNCHTVFKPTMKEAFWARHTPTTRKLTCTSCGHHGFCVEVYGKEDEKNG